MLDEPRDRAILRAFLNAPDDDEPTTDADLLALEEASAEHERGETVPFSTFTASPTSPSDARTQKKPH